MDDMRQVYTAIIEDALDIARAQHPRGAAGVLAEAYVALRAERDALRELLDSGVIRLVNRGTDGVVQFHVYRGIDLRTCIKEGIAALEGPKT
jgi:hypothetical protein